MAVWYIRNMAACGVALRLFLLGYYHSIRQRRRSWRLPLQLQFSTLPFAPGNLDEPAREPVETDKHTKKQTTLFTICAERLRKSRVEIQPGGRNSRRMKHQGKKANVTQGESDPFDAMPPVAWSKFPRLIGRAGRNKKQPQKEHAHTELHRCHCCCLIIPAAVSSIKLAHEVSEWASDDECCGVVAAKESSVACWFAALLWLAAMAVGAAAANNNNNVDASNKEELPSLKDLNNETVDLVITCFHCFFFHVAAMSKMIISCLVSLQPRLILARS